MRIGIYSYFGYPLSFEERVDLIRGAGFLVTGVGLGMEEDLVRAGKAGLMVDLSRERGLEVEYVHAQENRCNDLWSADEGRRRGAAQLYSDGIGYCAKHDVGILVVHLGRSKGVQPEGPNGHGLEAVRDLVRCAEDSGVRIAVENTQKEELVDFILGNVESPCLGLCYDSSHDFLYGREPGRLLGSWGKRLVATHIGDNDGAEDRHWLPGEGSIRWDTVRDRFPGTTYEGCLMLEVFPKDVRGEGAAEFLGRTLRSIERSRLFLSGEDEA